MAILEVFVFLFYAGWLFFSLLAQGETRVNMKVKKLDFLNVIPDYQFFCPKPTIEDYHLYFRGLSLDESWGEWIEASIGRRNLWYCYLWNPGKRSRKVFQKVAKVIPQNYPNKKKRYGSVYRLLLNYVVNDPRIKGCVATQFKITSRQNLSKDSLDSTVFLSNVHPIASDVPI